MWKYTIFYISKADTKYMYQVFQDIQMFWGTGVMVEHFASRENNPDWVYQPSLVDNPRREYEFSTWLAPLSTVGGLHQGNMLLYIFASGGTVDWENPLIYKSPYSLRSETGYFENYLTKSQIVVCLGQRKCSVPVLCSIIQHATLELQQNQGEKVSAFLSRWSPIIIDYNGCQETEENNDHTIF